MAKLCFFTTRRKVYIYCVSSPPIHKRSLFNQAQKLQNALISCIVKPFSFPLFMSSFCKKGRHDNILFSWHYNLI